jgi:hypothetical protein
LLVELILKPTWLSQTRGPWPSLYQSRLTPPVRLRLIPTVLTTPLRV